LAAKLPLQDPRQLAQHPLRRRRPPASVADLERVSHELKASRTAVPETEAAHAGIDRQNEARA
jgi:hypothetical protein